MPVKPTYGEEHFRLGWGYQENKQDIEGHTTKTERNNILRVKTVVFKSCMTRRNGQPHVWGQGIPGRGKSYGNSRNQFGVSWNREEAGVSVVE